MSRLASIALYGVAALAGAVLAMAVTAPPPAPGLRVNCAVRNGSVVSFDHPEAVMWSALEDGVIVVYGPPGELYGDSGQIAFNDKLVSACLVDMEPANGKAANH